QSRSYQRLKDDQVLPRAKRAEKHRALDDLARARVGDRLPVGPAARGTIDPVHDFVADIERIGACRKHIDLERILEPGIVERLGPPAYALLKRRPHRLGRASVDVEDDRLLDRRTGGGRIDLLEPESPSEVVHDRLTERRGEIDLLKPDRVAVRVLALDIAGLGERDQRMAKH